MSTSHATIVVVHSVQVVDERLGLPAILAFTLDRQSSLDLVSLDERLHVESFDGEVDVVVNLVARVPTRAKALERKDEDVGDLPDLDLLRRLLVLLAVGAVPRVVLAESLLLGELAKAVLDRDRLLLPALLDRKSVV